MNILRPQAGFQTRFCASAADIAIGGGAARSGKTFAALLMAAKYFQRTLWEPVIFRRESVDIYQPDGLWAQATKIYPSLGGWGVTSEDQWRWHSGARVHMRHLQHEKSVDSWQGSMTPLFIFDELTHFLESQFWYIISRSGAVGGVKPRIRATCNPDAESWVANLIAWWIDQDPQSPRYGLPILERAGKLRYLSRVNDTLVWGDTREEVMAQASIPADKAFLVKSITFIPGKLEDNAIFEAQDPTYRGNLMLQNRVVRGRLLDGNWKIRALAGEVFRRHEVSEVSEATLAAPSDSPDRVVQWVRSWDLAATEPNEENRNPDWTCGVLMGKRASGRFVIGDAIFLRKREDVVRDTILRTAANDRTRFGMGVKIRLPQDPGQAGKSQLRDYVRILAGHRVVGQRETGDKMTRAGSLAASWQHNNVDVVVGGWNHEYFDQMEGFPRPGTHDDAVDASSGAFEVLTVARPGWTI